MTPKVLIYGAGGFSGRLLARRAAVHWRGRGVELLLGGRRASTVQPLAGELGLATRCFALDDERAVAAAIGEPGLAVVINAAGPFAATALPLARTAVRLGRHYVDLNGESDVYRRLDDLGYAAAQSGATLVSGAGHSAVTSDLMLEQALSEMAAAGRREAGTVRIAYSHVKYTSQGSAQTAWRSVREQVVVMRGGPEGRDLRPTHVPLGQIERAFDFGDRAERRGVQDPARSGSRRIATACNLLDLHTARLTAQRHLDDGRLARVRAIEAFIEMPEGARIFVQLGTLSAPLLALPAVRRLVQAQVALLPEGPDERERLEDRHTVLLEIDDGMGTTLVDWRMETPDPYDFTADCAIAVTEGVLRQPRPGWRTPSEVVDVCAAFADVQRGLWRDCRFERRRDPQPRGPAAVPPTAGARAPGAAR